MILRRSARLGASMAAGEVAGRASLGARTAAGKSGKRGKPAAAAAASNSTAAGKTDIATTTTTTTSTTIEKKDETTTADERVVAAATTTLPRKRRRTATAVDSKPRPVATPPTAVRLVTDGSASAGDANGDTSTAPQSPPPPLTQQQQQQQLLLRPAEPHATNAPLLSPGSSSSRVVAAYEPSDQAPPAGSSALPGPTTTTGSLLEEACAHLIKVDPRLKAAIDKYPCPLFTPESLAQPVDPFGSLTSGIISQQVSGAAAKSIKTKFVALFTDAVAAADDDELNFPFPSPSQVAQCDVARLRTAGLSQRKAEYIKGLAEKFASGELSADLLAKASYEEVLDKLTAVRGLGKWSVEMFACFGLKRMDVFSTGDLGVQRGMAAYMGKDVSKLKAKGGGKWKYMSEKDMLDISAKFAPYRSLFMWYMWRIEDVNLDALQ